MDHYSDGTLRKRTKEFSSPSPMARKQDQLKQFFPEIFFTDEFSEQESGTTSCLVGGITSDLKDLMQMVESPFDLKFEDGRLCLTHTPGSPCDPPAGTPHFLLLLSVVWFFCLVILCVLKVAFHEKYSELLSSYSV